MAHVRQTRPDPEWLQVKRSEDVLNCSLFGRMHAVPEFAEVGEGARESGGEPLSSEYGTQKTVKAIFWPWLPDILFIAVPSSLRSDRMQGSTRAPSGW